MVRLDQLLTELPQYLPGLAILLLLAATLKILGVLAARRKRLADYKRSILPQFLMVAVAAGGVLLIVLTLPLRDATRGQVLGLLGVVFTGIIALSSTTFVTNALAGLMLRLIRNYKSGDFIQVGDNFGRVTERGLFHTEIQTEERNLTTFPNLYLVNNPMTVLRSSGTIISATLSLGYDVPHQDIEQYLLDAAQQSGLQEPFVQLVDLGDFSITYKISGFLAETKQLLAARSNLRRWVLDVMHRAGVEIVSPNFMNQRVLPKDAPIIPDQTVTAPKPGDKPFQPPESVIFDKAETAEEMDQWRNKLAALTDKRNALGKKKDDHSLQARAKLDTAIGQIKRKIEKFDQLLRTDDEIKKA